MMLILFIVSVKGSTEEQIKNDLQAVAEGVAASVFQPASTSNPGSFNDSIQANVIKGSAEYKTKVEVIIYIHF